LKALAAYREGTGRESRLLPSPSFEAQALLMLAECSLNLRKISRARRLTMAAKRMSRAHDLPLGLAYSELLLGCIDEQDGQGERALQRWRRAAALATRIDYQRIVFTAEVEVFRQARRIGDFARAKASKRRLDRLVPWIPKYIPAYRRFKELISEEGKSHEELPKVLGTAARDGARALANRRLAPRHRPRPAVVGLRVPTADR
jgi:hypothetical protein